MGFSGGVEGERWGWRVLGGHVWHPPRWGGPGISQGVKVGRLRCLHAWYGSGTVPVSPSPVVAPGWQQTLSC
ncbi:hypothetical protein AV530_013172 [Patagioenas fasciata monilis]|uniref:Uncharacterized protein n=1 Tax=Patagioenas fasciata monilis TaxID=372326 RepID=A0A1V4K4F6_PATFA|nr:hypothetical protein AV530_013172 [Patagioenas fasciata monilis]